MSRGHGKVQREIVRLLRSDAGGLTTTSITKAIYGEARPARRVAVRRAMARLVAEGRVCERSRLSARGDKRWSWRRAPVELPRRKPKRARLRGQMELPGIDGRRDRKFDLSTRNVLNPLGKKRRTKRSEVEPTPLQPQEDVSNYLPEDDLPPLGDYEDAPF